jgi:hypothetical protein
MSLGSDEQRAAFRSLRAVAAPLRLRVTADREGWPMVPGRLGQLEYHDGVELAVYSEHPRVFGKLEAIPGTRPHQIGDVERRWLFPPEALEQVAEVIRARRRRTLSSARARTLGASTAYRATSGVQDRV